MCLRVPWVLCGIWGRIEQKHWVLFLRGDTGKKDDLCIININSSNNHQPWPATSWVSTPPPTNSTTWPSPTSTKHLQSMIPTPSKYNSNMLNYDPLLPLTNSNCSEIYPSTSSQICKWSQLFSLITFWNPSPIKVSSIWTPSAIEPTQSQQVSTKKL